MQSNLPKQYLLLENKPVLMHTIEKFYASETKPHLIIAIDSEMEDFWKSLCKQYHFTIPHSISYGGKTRFQTVKKGIAFIKKMLPDLNGSAIAVHDGARPLIQTSTIDLAFEKVKNLTEDGHLSLGQAMRLELNMNKLLDISADEIDIIFKRWADEK